VAEGKISFFLEGGYSGNLTEAGAGTAWAYIGQYYNTPPDLQPGAIGQIVVTCSPIVNYLNSPGNDTITALASIWLPVYDADWNHLTDWNSAQFNIIQPGTTPGFWGQSYTVTCPLNLTALVESGVNIGVFVEFFANAPGQGGGDTSSLQLKATVPAITIEAQEWVQP
jgi:hypothetical protein